MKHKEFAIWPLFGLDLTPRKTYRYRLSLNKSVIEAQREEIDELKKSAARLEQKLKEEQSYNAATEEVNRKLEAEAQVYKSEIKRLDGEVKRQYKAYKALAERQEVTEKELDAVLEAKKAVEIDNAMLQEKVEWQMRKIKKLDQPRKKGKFSKNHSEPSFAPAVPAAEETAEAVAVVEEVENIAPDTTGAPEQIGEVIATAEVVEG